MKAVIKIDKNVREESNKAVEAAKSAFSFYNVVNAMGAKLNLGDDEFFDGAALGEKRENKPCVKKLSNHDSECV